MNTRGSTAPMAAAVVAGMVLWFATSLLTGKREPWDDSLYWVVAYPAALLVCAYLGYTYPERPWRWALLLFESQFIAMCIRNGEVGSLWPLGVALFAALAWPGILAAKRASRLGSRAA